MKRLLSVCVVVVCAWAFAFPASAAQIRAGLVNLATMVTGTLPVANGGTGASSASITAFNNITGYTASGATGTTSTNLVFSTSPTLVTPTLGVASATSINKVTITSPATSATLTIPDGVTLNAGAGGTLGSNAFTSTAYLPLAGGTMVGNLIFTDNLYDIGATAATRPRTIYVGTNVASPLFTIRGSSAPTLTMANDGSGVWVLTAASNGGTAQGLDFVAEGNQRINFKTNGADRWQVRGSGELRPVSANAVDLGASSLPVRTGYFGTSVIGGGALAIATTSTDGAVWQNTTATTSGVTVQYSPRFRFAGTAWNTTATAASNVLDVIEELRPVSAATPTSTLFWAFRQSVAGTGAFTDRASLTSAGTFNAVAYTVNGAATLTGTACTVFTSGLCTTGTTPTVYVNDFLIPEFAKNGLDLYAMRDELRDLRAQVAWLTSELAAMKGRR